MFSKRISKLLLLLGGLWLSTELATHVAAEMFWFQEVGYLSEFLLRLQTQVKLWAIAPISAIFMLANLAVAEHFCYRVETLPPTSVPSKQKSGLLGLEWLLPVVLALSLLIGLILFHYGQVALNLWNLDLALPRGLPPLPPRFAPKLIWKMWTSSPIWQVGIWGVLTIAIIVRPKFLLRAIAILMSFSFGLIISKHWAKILQYFHATSFSDRDPVFHLDISFYIFTLPVWELLEFVLLGMFFYAFLAVSLTYLVSENSLSQGIFPVFSQQQRRHFYGLLSAVTFCLAFSFWIRRYQLLYSTRGLIYGASYTDVTVQLPAYTAISLLALAFALFCLAKAVFGFPKSKNKSRQFQKLFTLCFVILCTISLLIPTTVQYLAVEPNELEREKPYIERSIKLSRQAFNLDNIEVKTFNPQTGLTYADLLQNDQTIRNIRLWDTRPLLQTNRQLQQIRPYYKFPSADIDRYTFQLDKKAEKRQVILAARELDYTTVPAEAKTWVNEHLVYTHGYGFTMSPVNTFGQGGLPEYFVKDIGDSSLIEKTGALHTSSPEIRNSIPIGYPRIYYGELTDTYVMTGTKVKELDYPSRNENIYNTYDGKGGIAIESWWKKLLFANYLNDWQMLFTQNFTAETKLLFRRNINERVRAIAPFLRYDSQPYLVVVDASKNADRRSKKQNYLYWIIDAYSTSERYPYSDPGEEKINYIRNSVKVVIDVYNGDVNLYIADHEDPIIKTWSAIFPKMFKLLDAMPSNLRNHIRYPVDLFNIQATKLLTYHMTDAKVFYNREDLWNFPNEIYDSKSQPVEPYYLIMKLPTARSEEFILLMPFTPVERTNLIAWLAARSDGNEYGKMLLYQFPKQQLIYGTEQIEALINQDPVISQQISLWNRQGARTIQGNLLVIPIESSLLYVEPLYLESEQNSLPTLVRVIVAYQNRVVMAENLEEALKAIFVEKKPSTPAIVRPI